MNEYTYKIVFIKDIKHKILNFINIYFWHRFGLVNTINDY